MCAYVYLCVCVRACGYKLKLYTYMYILESIYQSQLYTFSPGTA